jgi:hypothetical protein
MSAVLAVWSGLGVALAAPLGAACAGYSVVGAGMAAVNGCYLPAAARYGSPAFELTGNTTLATLYRWEDEWVIGQPGVVAYYISTCKTSAPPGASSMWYASGGAAAATPTLAGALPPGECPPPPPPSPVPPPSPHPSCSSPECDALWGPGGCPDLYSVPADLERPPMVNATPAAGARVRAVAPGFERTQAYHPLYLPTEWSTGGNKTCVVWVWVGWHPPTNRPPAPPSADDTARPLSCRHHPPTYVPHHRALHQPSLSPFP